MDPTPGKNGRPRRLEPGVRVRLQYMLSKEISDKLDEISRAMSIPRTHIVTLAIIRMHDQEVRAKTKEPK